MDIRYINKNEEADFQKVSALSFIWKFDAEQDSNVNYPVLGAFDDDKLVAGVELYEYSANYCKNSLNALVISGVCSLPEYRRSGSISSIFKKIGEMSVEKNWSVGFLSPFSIVCYEKFGYANLNRMFSVRVPFDKLSDIPRNTSVELYTGEQFDLLSELHNKCALKENLVTFRNDKKHFCQTPFESADYTYFRRDENGVPDGYVRFTVNRPNELVVEDLFVLTPQALFGIVGFLRNYDGIVKDLVVNKQYQGSAFACLADRVDKAVFEYNGATAARIYDIKTVLENNAYPSEYGRFRLLSTDPFEHNSGIFEVEYQNGKAVVSRKSDGDYDILLTPPAAARLLLAGEGHNTSSASFINGVQFKNNADDFFRAFPYRQTRFCDSHWSV